MHPDVFERLVNLRQQQENSIESIERLRDEHKSWQDWTGLSDTHSQFFDRCIETIDPLIP